MRSAMNSILVLLLLSAPGIAQSEATRPSLKARDTPAGATANIPSEATVDSFLQQTFGWQKDLTWKIASIKPSLASGLSEVTVFLATPQGQQLSKFYVSPDGGHALVGDIIPYGQRPFEAAKKPLEE